METIRDTLISNIMEWCKEKAKHDMHYERMAKYSFWEHVDAAIIHFLNELINNAKGI